MDKKKAFCSKQSFETLQMSHASLKNVMLICRTEHAFCFLIPKMTTEVDVFNPISKNKLTRSVTRIYYVPCDNAIYNSLNPK